MCHVGFADGKKPYVLAFNYGYAAGTVYIHCATEGRKMGIIRKNPDVFFFTENGGELKAAAEPCAYGFKYKSVAAPGRGNRDGPGRKDKGAQGNNETHCFARF